MNPVNVIYFEKYVENVKHRYIYTFQNKDIEKVKDALMDDAERDYSFVEWRDILPLIKMLQKTKDCDW